MSEPPKKKYWTEMNDEERLDAYQDAVEDFRNEAEAGAQLRKKLDELATAHAKYLKIVQTPGTMGEESDDAASDLLEVVSDIVDWYTAAETLDPHER